MRMKQAEEMPFSSLLRYGCFCGLESVLWNAYKQLRLKELMTAVLGEKNYGSLKEMLGVSSNIPRDSSDPGKKNLITREGETREAYSLQSAGMELSRDELAGSLGVFKEPALFLKRNFPPPSQFKIVFLPSVVAAYETKGPVFIQTCQNGRDKISYAENQKRSRFVRSEIGAFAAEEKIPFVDATQKIVEAGREKFIRGPRDWKHFNRKGYDTVCDAIKENF